jgi:hypothetical protein
VFFSTSTGRITSVVASADKALAAENTLAACSGGRVTLRGSFTAVYDRRDPQRNLASQPVHEVVLDGRTGKVLAVR